MRTQKSSPSSHSKTTTSEAEKEKLINNKDKRKSVIISVYVEDMSPRSIHNNGTKESNHKSWSLIISKNRNTAKARGFDRRAQLLAYARELRQNPAVKMPEWPQNRSEPRPKGKVMGVTKLWNPARIEFEKSRTRYRQLVPEVDISCRPKTVALRKKKRGNKGIDFRFVGKLRGIITGFCRE